MNRIVQSFWYSQNPNQNTITPIEILCIASYLHHQHEFHLYTYTPNDASMINLQENLKNSPYFQNLYIKDAREIMGEEKIFFDDRGQIGIAAFSDLFRFSMLEQKGGWWVDMDTICLQPINFAQPYVFATERKNDKKEGSATCIIKAPKNSPFLKELLTQANHIIQEDRESVKRMQKTLSFKIKLLFKPKLKQKINKNHWGIIGPLFLERMLDTHQNMQQYIVPAEYFCHINFWEPQHFIDPNFTLPQNKTIYTLHVWNAMWENFTMDKNTFPKGSLLQKLQDQFLCF